LEIENDLKLRRVSIRDFIVGDKIIDLQLKPNRVVGWGIFLEKVEKTIKPVWDKSYKKLVEQKFYKKEHFLKSLWDCHLFESRLMFKNFRYIINRLTINESSSKQS
jgi:hypothetical protein